MRIPYKRGYKEKKNQFYYPFWWLIVKKRKEVFWREQMKYARDLPSGLNVNIDAIHLSVSLSFWYRLENKW